VRRLIVPLLAIATFARAGTLDDMDLRSNVESSIRGTAQTAMLHLKIDVTDGVVKVAGVVRDLNQADDVVQLATRIKGVKDVDRSQLRLEFQGPPDAQIAALVDRQVLRIPKFAASSMQVAVDAGVVTLSGSIKNAAWRRELRQLCGAIEGVVDVVDRLGTPDTPDEKIQRVLDGTFGPRVLPPFPGKVKAMAKDGTVTLEGRVPRLYDRRTAEQHAWGINGVRRVDNRLELGSGTHIEVIRP
jgi:osmotically-inducible protein OsmY